MALLPGLINMSLYLNSLINYNLAWNFKRLTTLIMRSNWRGKSTTCTWCHWINLIWTMRPSRYFKYLLPQFSTLLLLFIIIQLCHITNGLMSPEDVSRNNFDKNIVNTWLTCFSHNGLKPFLKKHCYSCVVYCYFGLGPIPKSKPKLADTFGRYRNRYQIHISKGESSYQ